MLFGDILQSFLGEPLFLAENNSHIPRFGKFEKSGFVLLVGWIENDFRLRGIELMSATLYLFPFCKDICFIPVNGRIISAIDRMVFCFLAHDPL